MNNSDLQYSDLQSYIDQQKGKYLVYITPESGVGGEFPTPIPIKGKKQVLDYTRECRLKGQKTRVVYCK